MERKDKKVKDSMSAEVYTKWMLQMKEKLYERYIKYEPLAKYLRKMLMAFLTFQCIAIAYPYKGIFCNVFVIFGLAVLAGFLFDELIVILSLLFACAQLYFLTPILAGIVFASCILIYMMMLRYSPKTIWVAIMLPVALALHIPLAVVIPIGLFFSPMASLSVAGATVIYYVLDVVRTCALTYTDKTDIMELGDSLVKQIVENPQMYVSVVVLCGLSLFVYFIRFHQMALSFELSIGMATVLAIILFLSGNVFCRCNFSVQACVLGSFSGGLIALIIQMYCRILDYGAVEQLRFEDEDYYYYVKAVPKLKHNADK